MKSKIKKILEFNIVHVETVSVPRDTSQNPPFAELFSLCSGESYFTEYAYIELLKVKQFDFCFPHTTLKHHAQKIFQ